VRRFFHRLRQTFLAPSPEFDAELQSLIDIHAAELIDRGVEPEAARSQALRRAGNLINAKESYWDAASFPILRDLGRDLVYGWRRLRQRPVFLGTAVLTLAIGIGANATIFTMVESLILRPLPFPEPRSVVSIEGTSSPNLSYPNYLDIAARQQVFSHTAATRMMPITIRGDGAATVYWSYMVSGEYFPLLGIQAWRGRLLGPEDNVKDGAHPSIVISHARWLKEFGGQDSAIGREIRLNGQPFTIVGVTPPGFLGHLVFYNTDLWVPFSMIRIVENRDWRASRGAGNAAIIARLKAGVDPLRAESSLAVIAAQLAKEHPANNEGMRLSVTPVGWLSRQAGTAVHNAGAALLLVSLLTLLIACANLSGLVATQTADRRKELALRVSLGAGRAAVYRLVFAETLLVALLGGAAGILIAFWFGKAIGSMSPAQLPLRLPVNPDWSVVLYGGMVALCTAFACAWFPARKAAREDALPALQDLPLSGVLRRLAFRDLLTSAQVVIAVVLLSAAMMMISAFRAADRMPLGIRPEGAVVVGFDLGMRGYKQAEGLALQRRIMERVRALPGITVASHANSVPLSLDNSNTSFFVEGRPEPPASRRPGATIYQASPGIFEAMGTTLLAGRDFTDADTSQAKRVVIVNQLLADRQFKGESPLGKRIRQCSNCDWLEIVGVVESGVYQMISENRKMAIWSPIEQSYNGSMRIVARGTVGDEALIRSIRDVVRREDPDLAIMEAHPYNLMLDLPMTPIRLMTSLLAGMGMLAALLCGLGLYGTVSYGAARRTRELGIRAALGATLGQLGFAVVKRIAILTAVSATLGLMIAIGATKFLASLLNTPLEASAFGQAIGLLVFTAVLACASPSIRAMRVQPSEALRTG